MIFVATATPNREGHFSKPVKKANCALEATVFFISQSFFFCRLVCLQVCGRWGLSQSNHTKMVAPNGLPHTALQKLPFFCQLVQIVCHLKWHKNFRNTEYRKCTTKINFKNNNNKKPLGQFLLSDPDVFRLIDQPIKQLKPVSPWGCLENRVVKLTFPPGETYVSIKIFAFRAVLEQSVAAKQNCIKTGQYAQLSHPCIVGLLWCQTRDLTVPSACPDKGQIKLLQTG